MLSLTKIIKEFIEQEKTKEFPTNNFSIRYIGKEIIFSPLNKNKPPKFRSIIADLQNNFSIYSIDKMPGDNSIVVKINNETELGKIIDFISNSIDKSKEIKRQMY